MLQFIWSIIDFSLLECHLLVHPLLDSFYCLLFPFYQIIQTFKQSLVVTFIFPLNIFRLITHWLYLALNLCLLKELINLQIHLLQSTNQVNIEGFKTDKHCLLLSNFGQPVILSFFEFSLTQVETTIIYLWNVYFQMDRFFVYRLLLPLLIVNLDMKLILLDDSPQKVVNLRVGLPFFVCSFRCNRNIVEIFFSWHLKPIWRLGHNFKPENNYNYKTKVWNNNHNNGMRREWNHKKATTRWHWI